MYPPENERLFRCCRCPSRESSHPKVIDPGLEHTLAGPLWEGCRESRRCSRDTYPESYITKYTSIRRLKLGVVYNCDLAWVVERYVEEKKRRPERKLRSCSV